MTFGVDEAGRGPVLGSLFVAAVRADPDELPGAIRDSKQLSAGQREALAAELRTDDRIAVSTVAVSPAEIDDPETDLNTLTVRAGATAIDGLAPAGSDGTGDTLTTHSMAGIVDACDTDAARFGRRVADATTVSVDVTAKHRADESHEIVGAASIVAKVARDAHIERLAETHGALGSGYPSDPTTREFLREYVREHGEVPPFARASWATSHDVLAAAEQSALGEF